MEILNQDEYFLRQDEILRKIKGGAVFIYPTDTIYGMGSSALHHGAIDKIREAKGNYQRPLSVIAPSKDWIREHCELSKKADTWLDKLPGPYTLLLKLKDPKAVSPKVNPEEKTIGVRLPKHWSWTIARDLGEPIITTAANVMGKEFMTSLENLDQGIRSKTHFVIYDGEKTGKPSEVIDLTK